MKIVKVRAIYCVLLGIAMLGMWSTLLITKSVPEINSEVINISFHLFSEFLTALMLVFSGYGLLARKKWGERLFQISMGLLIYSVINAAGYYGQQGEIAVAIMFTVLFIVSSLLVILSYRKNV